MLKTFLVLVVLISTSTTVAEEWCFLEAGEYYVITHGTKSPKVWLIGTFVGQTTGKWVLIKTSTYGESSVAVALAAQLAGKGVSVYVDGVNDTCANYVSSTGPIRHVRIDN